jgi:diketogulonate reductase-like aldo/keto reductase
MPSIGLGTYKSTNKEELENVIKKAVLEYGYRHIDTASAYDNEDAIGNALKYCMD